MCLGLVAGREFRGLPAGALGVSCCLRRAGVGSVPDVSGTPLVPGDAAAADKLITGLRAANARLRDLLAERDARIAGLEVQVARIADLETLVADLQAQVADLAAKVKQNSKNSSRPPSSDGLGKPEPKSLRKKTGRKPGLAEGAARRDDGADRSSRSRSPAPAAIVPGVRRSAWPGLRRRGWSGGR